MRIFLAGAAGVIGRRLTRMLVDDGHHVTGTTRSQDRAEAMALTGAVPCLVDVYDADKLREAVVAAQPDVVIHQLTDLPQQPDSAALVLAFEKNARLRMEGTANLVAAAQAAGARRVVAQSVAFLYAPGQRPATEETPFDTTVHGPAEMTLQGILELERLVTQTPDIEGVVLRYGRIYGPGAWVAGPTAKGFVHADAAAQAARLAATRGRPGIYNIADDDGEVSIGKARREFGFDPSFRLS